MASIPPMSDGLAVEVSVVLPCLDEERTLAACIADARACLQRAGITHEIVIADNGSTDGSIAVAERAGARVVHVTTKGYGAAVLGGLRGARGDIVVIADADGSYALHDIVPFVQRVRSGDDLVVGDRFRGGIARGAMPPLHRYLGTPTLSLVCRLLTGTEVRDVNCGLRAGRRERLLGIGLSGRGFEGAAEMVGRAARAGLRISQLPTPLAPDGRDRPPHIRTWSDGARVLRTLLAIAREPRRRPH